MRRTRSEVLSPRHRARARTYARTHTCLVHNFASKIVCPYTVIRRVHSTFRARRVNQTDTAWTLHCYGDTCTYYNNAFRRYHLDWRKVKTYRNNRTAACTARSHCLTVMLLPRSVRFTIGQYFLTISTRD